MSEDKLNDEGFAFTVIDDDGENVTIEVSEADCLREKSSGVDEAFLLKPGRYKVKRGGFLARHPELKIGDRRRA
jgi:hypothetical protein